MLNKASFVVFITAKSIIDIIKTIKSFFQFQGSPQSQAPGCKFDKNKKTIVLFMNLIKLCFSLKQNVRVADRTVVVFLGL